MCCFTAEVFDKVFNFQLEARFRLKKTYEIFLIVLLFKPQGGIIPWVRAECLWHGRHTNLSLALAVCWTSLRWSPHHQDYRTVIIYRGKFYTHILLGCNMSPHGRQPGLLVSEWHSKKRERAYNWIHETQITRRSAEETSAVTLMGSHVSAEHLQRGGSIPGDISVRLQHAGHRAPRHSAGTSRNLGFTMIMVQQIWPQLYFQPPFQDL